MLGIYSTEKTQRPGGLDSVQPSHEILYLPGGKKGKEKK